MIGGGEEGGDGVPLGPRGRGRRRGCLIAAPVVVFLPLSLSDCRTARGSIAFGSFGRFRGVKITFLVSFNLF